MVKRSCRFGKCQLLFLLFFFDFYIFLLPRLYFDLVIPLHFFPIWCDCHPKHCSPFAHQYFTSKGLCTATDYEISDLFCDSTRTDHSIPQRSMISCYYTLDHDAIPLDNYGVLSASSKYWRLFCACYSDFDDLRFLFQPPRPIHPGQFVTTVENCVPHAKFSGYWDRESGRQRRG